MARFASIDADCGVFEDERTALVHVALDARLFVAESLIHHARAHAHPPGWRKYAVRVVAIRTVHEPFVNPVFGRHRELRAHR
jgi:hypothetical protein